MSRGFSLAIAQLLVTRDQVCVSCGMPAQDKHHRRRRREDSDGLAHLPANGILLCGRGNVTGCHGLAHRNPAWGRSMGYIVRPGESPLAVPLRHFSRGLILLDNEGGWLAVENGGRA